MPPEVKMYSKDYCPYCRSAKNLFKNKNVAVEEIDLTDKPEEFDKLKAQTGMMTVPQIFINGKLIGGYSDVAALDQKGELDKLLQG